MKKRFLSRIVSLSLLALLLLGLLAFSGCAVRNPANGNLVPVDAKTGEIIETQEGQSAETTETGEKREVIRKVDVSKLSTEVKMGAFDYVKQVFSYLLRWLYDLTGSYGIALILFALIVKIILLPASAMSKKSMMKMSRLTPRVKALEAKFGDDKQGYQAAVNQLYKEEGAGGCGGCIWSLLPMLLLIPLYEIIREPITWLMFHGSSSMATLGKLQNVLIDAKIPDLDITNVYWQMQAIPHLTGDVLTKAQAIDPAIVSMNTKLLGVELATIPKLMFWKYLDAGVWNAVGQFLLPLVSGGVNLVTMLISQKLNNTVIVDEKGQQDAQMAKQNQTTGKAMTYMMPLMSVYIGFVAPAGLSLYWITQGVFGLIQEYFLTKHYKKIYDAEDAVKQAKAAEEAAQEAERERLRRQRMAENPDGMVGSVSKKKLQQRERNEQAAKEAAYQEKNAPKKTEEELQKAEEAKLDESRPNRRGRNYNPDRYKAGAEEDRQDASDAEGASKE